MGRPSHLPLAFAIVAALVACTLCAPASLANAVGANAAAHAFFYNQLDEPARAIYDELEDAFEDGRMLDGATDIAISDAVRNTHATGADGKAADYSKVGGDILEAWATRGNQDLSNAFRAAKDAFDLEHPEAWYVDSSFLCLRPAKDALGRIHAIVGAGREDNYYLNGQRKYGKDGSKSFTPETIRTMDAELQSVLSDMVREVNELTAYAGEDEVSLNARKITLAHELVTHALSYRFENEVSKPENSLFVRTTYALVTHEGVCEAYARSLQCILDRAGIGCVLVNGMQTSGDNPEQHMWTYVQLGDTWYAVDPTWDDPVKMVGGVLDKTSDGEGGDGREVDTYLLVGTDTLFNWVPNGTFSAGGKEFAYPEVSKLDYVGGNVFNAKGLTVEFSSAGVQEGTASGKFTVRFAGKGIKAAGQNGYHLLVKAHQTAGDGEVKDDMDWSYAEAMLAMIELNGKNPYFYDDGEKFVMIMAQCDYVEFAMTTDEPEGYEHWFSTDKALNPLYGDTSGEKSVYRGTNILCETGLLRNVNGGYRAQPYMLRQYPVATASTATGTHIAKVVFDDALTYPTARDDMKQGGDAARAMKPARNDAYPLDRQPDPATSNVKDGFQDYLRVPESEANLLSQPGYKGDPTVKIRVSYIQKDAEGHEEPYRLQGDVNYDRDRDGSVDVDVAHLNWLYECNVSYPHQHTPYGYEDFGKGCRLVGVEFEMQTSAMWADDLTYYEFSIEGLVGEDSGKAANPWGYLVCDPECPYAYRSQGIDWSLWGRPNLLDNPDDLDLGRFALEGVDASGSESLAELQQSMNLERLNGRLTLVVEDLSDQRDRVEEMEDVLRNEEHVDDPRSVIKSRSLYEIGFSNICRKTISEVADGDSMRVQVGFPDGYDATSQGVVFKAYHFTRDDAGNIVDVQEIPVIVTEYGLLVLCDSFSPFEMVALDADQVSQGVDDDANVYTDSIVVAPDAHTTVTYRTDEGKVVDATVGDGAVVQLDEFGKDKSVTFTFQPDAGYELSGVTFAGEVKALASAGGAQTLTISADDLQELAGSRKTMGVNALLGATSIPTSVKERAKSELQLEDVAVGACTHATATLDGYRPPTCTESGCTASKVCSSCGMVLERGGEEIPATGHVSGLLSPDDAFDVKPDCLNGGVAKKVTCIATKDDGTVCGAVITEPGSVPALGHSFGMDGVCATCGLYDAAADQTLIGAKTVLEGAIESLRDLAAFDYTPESWAVYQRALDAAKAALNLGSTEPGTTAKKVVEAYEALVAAEAALVEADGPGDVVKVYRLFNPFNGEHLFTTDPAERASLPEVGWQDEGVAWSSPTHGERPVHRLFNPYTGEHHYTADIGEILVLGGAHWTYEGVAWFDGPEDAASVYRLYNPYRDGPGAHHFTADEAEYEQLGELGWSKEQVAWRAYVTK